MALELDPLLRRERAPLREATIRVAGSGSRLRLREAVHQIPFQDRTAPRSQECPCRRLKSRPFLSGHSITLDRTNIIDRRLLSPSRIPTRHRHRQVVQPASAIMRITHRARFSRPTRTLIRTRPSLPTEMIRRRSNQWLSRPCPLLHPCKLSRQQYRAPPCRRPFHRRPYRRPTRWPRSSRRHPKRCRGTHPPTSRRAGHRTLPSPRPRPNPRLPSHTRRWSDAHRNFRLPTTPSHPSVPPAASVRPRARARFRALRRPRPAERERLILQSGRLTFLCHSRRLLTAIDGLGSYSFANCPCESIFFLLS